MKKTFTLISAAMMAVVANAGIVATFDGAPVADGAVLTWGVDHFHGMEGIPGFELSEHIVVTSDALPVAVKGVSKSDIITCCTSENCFSLTDFDDDGEYTTNFSLKVSPETMEIDVKYIGLPELPVSKDEVTYTLTDKDGATMTFTVVVNSDPASVAGVAADVNAAYSICDLSGRVLKSGVGSIDRSSLDAGVYILRQGTKAMKIRL